MQKNVGDATFYLSELDRFSGCGKGKVPSGVRYSMSMHCYLATVLATSKGCPSPKNNSTVCSNMCQSANTTLSDYLCNTQLRTEQLYRETCQSAKISGRCLGPVELEMGNCGFFTIEEASAYCYTSKDSCCAQLVYPNTWLVPLLISLGSVLLLAIAGVSYWRRQWITNKISEYRHGKSPTFSVLQSGKETPQLPEIEPPSPMVSIASPTPSYSPQPLLYPTLPSPRPMSEEFHGYPDGNIILDDHQTQQVLYHDPVTLFRHNSDSDSVSPVQHMLMPMYVDPMGNCFMVYNSPSIAHSEIGVVGSTTGSDDSKPIDPRLSAVPVTGQVQQESNEQEFIATPPDIEHVPSPIPTDIETQDATPNQQQVAYTVPDEKPLPNMMMPQERVFSPKRDPLQVGEIVKVLLEYEPTMEDEIHLIPGQTIEIMILYNDGWAMGQTAYNQGMFPLCYTVRTDSKQKEIIEKPAKRSHSLNKL
jgi:hypothetical protein